MSTGSELASSSSKPGTGTSQKRTRSATSDSESCHSKERSSNTQRPSGSSLKLEDNHESDEDASPAILTPSSSSTSSSHNSPVASVRGRQTRRRQGTGRGRGYARQGSHDFEELADNERRTGARRPRTEVRSSDRAKDRGAAARQETKYDKAQPRPSGLSTSADRVAPTARRHKYVCLAPPLSANERSKAVADSQERAKHSTDPASDTISDNSENISKVPRQEPGASSRPIFELIFRGRDSQTVANGDHWDRNGAPPQTSLQQRPGRVDNIQLGLVSQFMEHLIFRIPVEEVSGVDIINPLDIVALGSELGKLVKKYPHTPPTDDELKEHLLQLAIAHADNSVDAGLDIQWTSNQQQSEHAIVEDNEMEDCDVSYIPSDASKSEAGRQVSTATVRQGDITPGVGAGHARVVRPARPHVRVTKYLEHWQGKIVDRIRELRADGLLKHRPHERRALHDLQGMLSDFACTVDANQEKVVAVNNDRYECDIYIIDLSIIRHRFDAAIQLDGREGTASKE